MMIKVMSIPLRVLTVLVMTTVPLSMPSCRVFVTQASTFHLDTLNVLEIQRSPSLNKERNFCLNKGKDSLKSEI
jgi:hypothetical protein